MGSLDHLISYCKANKLLNKLIPNGVKKNLLNSEYLHRNRKKVDQKSNFRFIWLGQKLTKWAPSKVSFILQMAALR